MKRILVSMATILWMVIDIVLRAIGSYVVIRWILSELLGRDSNLATAVSLLAGAILGPYGFVINGLLGLKSQRNDSKAEGKKDTKITKE